ncbi:MAG TPA: hypothetical protein VD887_01405 [Allosphingosinicella sp.]|nr:hypothetical protein [Allosphingosinicella sp.]
MTRKKGEPQGGREDPPNPLRKSRSIASTDDVRRRAVSVNEVKTPSNASPDTAASNSSSGGGGGTTGGASDGPGGALPPSARLNLDRFNVGDVASTFLYASAINTVMAKAAENGGSHAYLGAAFVVILMLDWLSRVFVLTNFPKDDQVFRGNGWLLIIKLCIECACVTLITTVAVVILDGEYKDSVRNEIILAMFAAFACWNYFVIGILQHVDFRHIVRTILYGYRGASGSLGKYLQYVDDLFQRSAEEAIRPNPNMSEQYRTAARATWMGVKKVFAMLAVIFLCLQIAAAPAAYAGLWAIEVYSPEARETAHLALSDWVFLFIPGAIIIALVGAGFAVVSTDAPVASSMRYSWGSISCFLSALLVVVLIGLYVDLNELLWIWFVQVSLSSFLVFFMSQERARAQTG